MITTNWIFGTEDLSVCHYIRNEVFTKEFNIPESVDLDDLDEVSYHLIVYDNKKPVATGRVGKYKDGAIVGRIAVLKDFRGQNLGDLVVRMLIRKAFEMGLEKQYIEAMVSAKTFYEKLGFIAVGETYKKWDIEHIDMYNIGDVKSCCDI